MKYFTDNLNRRGTCYHEFVRGKWDGRTFWDDGSMYLRDDLISDLKLFERVLNPAFAELGGKFNRWGENRITRDIWERMLSLAEENGGGIRELFAEIAPWAEKSLAQHDEFWILGI